MQKRRNAAISASLCVALVAFPTTASAYVSSGLLVYLDATDSNSFTTPSSAWTDLSTSNDWQDLSGNNVDGSFEKDPNGNEIGSAISYDSSSQSIVFPGGTHGTAWIELDTSIEKFDDFSGGFSIEFEGEFGATRANWERIFDFAEDTDSTPGDGETDYSFWLGQFGDSNELALEVFDNGVTKGYCHTSTGSTSGLDSGTDGTALGAGGSRDFAKWIVTIENDENKTCKIYKNGVALPVLKTMSAFTTYVANSGSTSGAAYSLPPTVNRESALIGGSNFNADADFEGRIRYIRVYDETLSDSEVAQNAGIADPPSSSSSSSQLGSQGIYLYIASAVGRRTEETPVYFGSVSIKPNTVYALSLQSVTNPALTRTILATGTVNNGGHLEARVELANLNAGTYKIVMTGTHRLDYPLVLTNYISVDRNGNFISLSTESLQPTLS